MEPFTTLTAVAAPLDIVNCDTDRIIPARFLRKPRVPGYERWLFHDMRFYADGNERADFYRNSYFGGNRYAHARRGKCCHHNATHYN